MQERDCFGGGTTRRQFVTAGAAAAAFGGTSLLHVISAVAAPPGRFRRLNLSDSAAAVNLRSYERAITEMLKLPPSDPRNWFRMAVIHLMDCPHGNWWFLPWHRGFLGWFELICRDLSKDPAFALPYWDWTTDPRLSAKFLEGNLNPANFPIKSVTQFKTEFVGPLGDFWKSLGADQLAQLKLRGLNSVDDLWKQIEGKADPTDTAPMFPEPADARNLNPPHSQEFDDPTNKAVALSTILDALGPRDFISFGSGKQPNHHEPTTTRPVFGVLEAQPHNLVHNFVGGYIQGNPSRQGFMTAFLSPSDPIFYMHHSNIDRLWDVWTRKQLAHPRTPPSAYPTTPLDTDLTAWDSEPFLFFVGVDGKPTAQKQSGDFVSRDAFNYDYQPGSGEVVVPTVVRPMNLLADRSFTSELKGMSALAPVSNGLSKAAGVEEGVRVVVTITAELPIDARTLRLNVILNPPVGIRSVSFRDPGFVGTFQLFGGHGHGAVRHQPSTVTFSLGLTDAIKRLLGTPRLIPDEPYTIRVVADTTGLEMAPPEIKVIDVIVKTF